MPFLLIGVLGGAAVTWYVSDKADTLIKWTVIGGVVYVGYRVWKG